MKTEFHKMSVRKIYKQLKQAPVSVNICHED